MCQTSTKKLIIVANNVRIFVFPLLVSSVPAVLGKSEVVLISRFAAPYTRGDPYSLTTAFRPTAPPRYRRYSIKVSKDVCSTLSNGRKVSVRYTLKYYRDMHADI